MISVVDHFSELLPSAVLWRAITNHWAVARSFALRLFGLVVPLLDSSIGNSASDYKTTGCVSPHPDLLTTNDTSIFSELLMVGNTSETWRIGDVVRKVYLADSDADITQANIEAARNEANVYLILKEHRLIAECLAIGAVKDYIDLRFYPMGTLRDYVYSNPNRISDLQRKTWACQLVESVAYIHSKGVRHADLRLDQWLLDEDLQPRLADFNGSGFDIQPELGLDSTPATSIESASHYLPRDDNEDSTVKSDLFALGSSIFELMANSAPYEGKDRDVIESNFAMHVFPPVEHLLLGNIIMGCWEGQYTSAEQILDHLRGTSSS